MLLEEPVVVWREVLRFSVDGKPQPAGSKKSFVPIDKRTGEPFRSKKTGRVVVNTVDANENSKPWKSLVGETARAAFNGNCLLDCAVRVDLVFRRRRNSGDYGSRKGVPYLKPNTRKAPTSKPDVLKLARGVEDALTEIVWLDDAQIVDEHLSKVYVGLNEREGVDVVVYVLD